MKNYILPVDKLISIIPTLPVVASSSAFGLLSLDMRVGNGLLSLHNNAKCFL